MLLFPYAEACPAQHFAQSELPFCGASYFAASVVEVA
jgi:hypothetical protein